MDKLEKAMEKARAQRGSHLGGTVAGYGAQTAMGAGDAASALMAGPLVLDGRDASVPTHLPDGVILSEAQCEAARIRAHEINNKEADLFRLLRTQILQMMEQDGLKTLAITSPNYGDGKTTIALNLAISMAQDPKQTVLLVDLDLRKPSVHQYLGLNPQFGLMDFLSGKADLSDCLVRLPFDRLTSLPVGQGVDRSSEVLRSPQMAALAHEMKERYPDRLIIYDMPPLLAQDDPLAFLPHVDAFLLVIQDGVTRTDEIKRCAGILSGARVLGTVLNRIVV